MQKYWENRKENITMGFFNNSTTGFNGYIASNANLEDLLEDVSIIDLPEAASFYQCALEATAMDEANWNGIMQACGLQEYAYFVETGDEFVYNEAAGAGFIESVRNFLNKVWEKIKSIFKKFMVFLGAHMKSGKEFINKYRSDINKAVANIPSNAQFNGYEFTLNEYKDKVLDKAATKFKNDVSSTLNNATLTSSNIGSLKSIDTIGNAKITVDDNWSYEDEMEKVRGGLLDKSGSTFSTSEFSKELFEMLRKGSSTKENMDLNSNLVTTAIAELDSGKEVKKAADDVYKIINKWFSDFDKALGKVQNEMSKSKTPNADDLKWVQRAISLTKGTSSAIQTANGIFLAACKDRENQAKAICVKVVSFKSKNEGYSFDNYDGSSFMEAAIARMQ